MSQKVVLYTTPMCGPCEQVKEYLRMHEVSFSVVDLLMDEGAAELLESKGIRSAPALGVDDEIIAGAALNPDKIDEMLGL